MRKHSILKTIVVILVLLVAVLLSGCTTEDYLYSEFSFGETEEILKVTSPDGSTVNEYVYAGSAYGGLLHGEKFIYERFVYFENGGGGMVYSALDNDNVLYVQVDAEIYCYVKAGDETALTQMRAFLDGEDDSLAFADLLRFQESILTRAEAEAFFADASTENMTSVDVQTLKGKLLYDIITYDENRVLALKRGAIFAVNGGYLLIDYDKLDNTAFDADGNFSYRKGTVEAEHIRGDKLTLFNTLQNRRQYLVETSQYEEGLYVGPEKKEITLENSRTSVVSLLVVIGLLVPLAPMIYLLCTFRSKKRLARVILEEEKRGIPVPLVIMGIGACLWVLSGLSLIVMFYAL